MSADEWIGPRLASATEAIQAAGHVVTADLVKEFEALLANEFQEPLKPAQLKEIVTRLAKANNPTS